MAELKTPKTKKSVPAFLKLIENEQRRNQLLNFAMNKILQYIGLVVLVGCSNTPPVLVQFEEHQYGVYRIKLYSKPKKSEAELKAIMYERISKKCGNQDYELLGNPEYIVLIDDGAKLPNDSYHLSGTFSCT